MGYLNTYLYILCFWGAVSLSARVGSAETLAFPGAEGFGAHTVGGRGGIVVPVTNLRDYAPGEEPSIPGSLRATCARKGPRIVVFRVSGTIELKTHLDITEPFVTIAGQTAPGDGICLKNYAIRIMASQVIVRCEPYQQPGRGFPSRLVCRRRTHCLRIESRWGAGRY